MLFPLCLLLAISPLFVCPRVYAGSDVDLSDFPAQLAEALSVDLFAGQILATIILLLLFLLPSFILTKNHMAQFIIGFMGLCLAIALGWVTPYFLIMTAFVVAILFAGKISGWKF